MFHLRTQLINNDNINNNILENPTEIINYCQYCGGEDDMAGAFSAKKIRQNMERDGCKDDLLLTKYSSKYMNSIWGNYNRYAVHNLKKVIGDNVQSIVGGRQDCGKSAVVNEKIYVEATKTNTFL